MNVARLEYLFNAYYQKTGTPGERNELMEMLRESESDPAIKDLIDRALITTGEEILLDNDTAEGILQSILQADRRPAVVRPMRKVFMKVAAAAIIFLLISATAYFLYTRKTDQPIAKVEQRFKNDVAPGGNKAILTLANGKQIILDSAANGTLTQQGNTKIIKLDSGQLAYNATGANNEVLTNTITTPKGGQYQIILADGSKVWLNAASSLRFPTAFTKDRNVELTGEGYFEVAHDATKPFHVSVNGMTVEVLGTHFNINAYEDEAIIKTTLLEGSVKVSKNSVSKIIKPGEQAQLNTNEIKIQKVDVDEAVAWKEGRFSFNGADIQTVMRQLARWYDVEVAYTGEVKEKFHVEMNRNTNVSSVFKILETTGGVHFKIEGKKITVMK